MSGVNPVGIGLLPPAAFSASAPPAATQSSLVQAIFTDPANGGVGDWPTLAGGLAGAAGLYGVYRTLSNAQIQALSATPVVLVPAAVNTIIIPVMGWARLIVASGWSTNSNMRFRYSAGSATDLCSLTSFFTSAGQSKFVGFEAPIANTNINSSGADIVNAALNISGSAVLTGGDAGLTCQVWLIYSRVIVQ